MQDIMIDLETLGTAETSIFFSCGACYFDRATGDIGATMYSTIDVQDSIDAGRTFSASTLKWWLSQDDAARSSVSFEGLGLKEFLRALSNFVHGNKLGGEDVKVWGNGATFDISMLANAYGEYNQPWKFWNVRDCRTVEELSTVDRNSIEREGVHHNALDDAVYQAKYISKMLQQLTAG